MNSYTVISVLLSCVAFVTSSVEIDMPIVVLETPNSVKQLPSNIPICTQSDLNLNDCLTAAFQQVFPLTKNGISELNIPPLDPLVIEKLNYQYNNGVLQGRLALRNLRISGFGDTKVLAVKIDMKDNNVNMSSSLEVPHIVIEGLYKADLKLNDLKMTPKGYFNLTMVDLKLKVESEGDLTEREGHRYLQLNKFPTNAEVGDMHIYATGLFPDDSLNALVLDYINQYWRQIFTVIYPQTQKSWEPHMLRLANEFLSSVSFDVLLPQH